MIVENTAARVICVADLKLKTTTKPDDLPDALLPGVNEVDPVEWAKAELIPVVQHLIKDGTLVPKREQSAADLSGMKATEATKLVENTFDKALLEKWFDGETRKGVLEAIEAQIDQITPKEKKDPQ